MDQFLIKTFGINRFNFFGWIVAGLTVIGATLFLLWEAYKVVKGLPVRADLLILTAIAVLLLGIFGILLQLYCSQLTEKLERQARERSMRDVRLDAGDEQR